MSLPKTQLRCCQKIITVLAFAQTPTHYGNNNTISQPVCVKHGRGKFIETTINFRLSSISFDSHINKNKVNYVAQLSQFIKVKLNNINPFLMILI